MCPRVSELLCEPEVDGVDQVALLAQPHQKVVRLDVAVDEVLAVDELDATDLLDRKLRALTCFACFAVIVQVSGKVCQAGALRI